MTADCSCEVRRTSPERPHHSRTGSPGRPQSFSLPEALTMATTNPGRIIGQAGGQLRPGTRIADVITFDWQPGDRELSFR